MEQGVLWSGLAVLHRLVFTPANVMTASVTCLMGRHRDGSDEMLDDFRYPEHEGFFHEAY